MKRILVSAFATLALVGTACGSSSSSGGALSATQTKAVAQLNKSLTAQKLTADQTCVTKLAKQLSEADAAILATDTTDPANDAKVSAAGKVIENQAILCVARDQLASMFAAQIGTGTGASADCVKKIIVGLTDAQLVAMAGSGSSAGTDPALKDVETKLAACATPTT